MSETIPSVPQSRVEQYLGTIIDQESAELPPVPQSRVEAYLDYIVKNAGRVKTMPTASSDYVGKIVQYTGETAGGYTNGYFYKCTASGSTYAWTQINVQPGGGGGGTDLDLSIVGGKLCVSFEEV